jgi:drug/metabolite transporter (DMT)-like permease
MHWAGIIYSIGAALFWAFAVILFKKGSETLSPIPLNLFKTAITTILLIPTLLAANVSFFPTQPVSTWVLFCVSGFLGITLADTLFFFALGRLGAGMMAIIDCLYLPSVLVLSFLFLDEAIGIQGLIGAVLVFAGIMIGTAAWKGIKVNRKHIGLGILSGLLAIFFLAGSLVMVKELLAQTHVLWASFIRMASGTLGLFGIILIRSDRKKIFTSLYPLKAWKVILPASIFGNYLAMIMWLAGMKYTMVSIAAVLNQLSTVFIFLFAAMFLHEPITKRKTISISLAIAGAILTATAT